MKLDSRGLVNKSAFLQASEAEVGGDDVETLAQEMVNTMTTENCSCPYRGEFVGPYPHDDDCPAVSRAPNPPGEARRQGDQRCVLRSSATARLHHAGGSA